MPKKRKKMWAQLMMLAGGLMLAFGGFWSWKNSQAEDQEKEVAHENRATRTESLVQNSTDTILKNQDTGFKKVEEAITKTKKIIKDMPKSKGDVTITGDNNRVVQGDNNGINGDVNITTTPSLGQAELSHILQMLEDHQKNKGKKITTFQIIIGGNSNGGGGIAGQVRKFLEQNGYVNMLANHGYTTQFGPMKPFEVIAYDDSYQLLFNP